MAVKLFHKDHGYVITSDQDQINDLLARGGKVVTKNKDIPVEIATEAIKPATSRYGKRK